MKFSIRLTDKHPIHKSDAVTPHQQKPDPKNIKPVDYLSALFLLVAVWFFPSGTKTDALSSLSIVFISIVLEAIPFLFVGSIIGGLIEVFVSRERLASFLPQRSWLTVCVAAGAGIVFPVCECAVVPVVRRLVGKGLPQSAAIGYLLGGPILNPIVAASTALAYAFDWRIVVLRLALGYGIAVGVGILMGCFFKNNSAIKEDCQDANASSCGCASHHHTAHPLAGGDAAAKSAVFPMFPNKSYNAACDCGCLPVSETDSWINKMVSAFRHAADDFMAVGHYFIISTFIAALAQTYIERSSFLKIAQMPFLSVGLMMVLAMSLNLCSEADAFIAASFRGMMPLPAQMAFMLTGPMFDLKLLLMYQRIFRRRAIFVLAALILTAVFGTSVGIEWIIKMIS